MAEKHDPSDERELPERWSPQRKAEVVLRLLKGEDLGALSREIQVPAHELEELRRVFLESATLGLRRRGGDAIEQELRRTQAKLGETLMRLELASDLLEKRGYAEELKKLLRNGRS